MNIHDLWEQALEPYAGDVPCMDEVDVYRQWVAEIKDEKCPLCGEPVLIRKAIVCINARCLFKTVTYRVLMAYGAQAS